MVGWSDGRIVLWSDSRIVLLSLVLCLALEHEELAGANAFALADLDVGSHSLDAVLELGFDGNGFHQRELARPVVLPPVEEMRVRRVPSEPRIGFFDIDDELRSCWFE